MSGTCGVCGRSTSYAHSVRKAALAPLQLPFFLRSLFIKEQRQLSNSTQLVQELCKRDYWTSSTTALWP